MARTNTTLHFPPEIIDIIIDFLHHDVQSLLACALVSRAWLPSSRFHLFRSRTIHPSRLEGAFHVITTTPDVATYIQQLTLVGGRYRHRDLTVGELEALLYGLPHLRRLSLHNFMFGKSGDTSDASPPLKDPQRRQAKLFALEELELLECDVVTVAKYADLYRLLGLFSSIQTLFLAANRTARELGAGSELLHPPSPQSALASVRVAVQRLHTFNILFPMLETLLTTLGATNALRTFWYDDNVLNWTEPDLYPGSSAVDRFGRMVASLGSPSHQHLHCLILGPLPIFADASRIGSALGLARLQLASIRGLQTFHLRGRWLEPHFASIFAALPDSIREARFVVVGISVVRREGARNRFRKFALAFSNELARRTRMTFVLDLGVAKKKLEEEKFGLLRDRAEKGFLRLAQQGRVLIDDSPKE